MTLSGVGLQLAAPQMPRKLDQSPRFIDVATFCFANERPVVNN
jgi:hypothetical protein